MFKYFRIVIYGTEKKLLAICDINTEYHLGHIFEYAGYQFDPLHKILNYPYSLSDEELYKVWENIPKGYDATIVFSGYEGIFTRLKEPQAPKKAVYWCTGRGESTIRERECAENLDLIIGDDIKVVTRISELINPIFEK
ncbi:MAG: hypothetical protein ACP5E4_02770 [Candidatus Aenigmatarchaeota archaeon]